MKLIDEFLDYFSEIGGAEAINCLSIYNEPEYDAVYFVTDAEDGDATYLVGLELYDDEAAMDILVGKKIKPTSKLNMLNQINDLNSVLRGASIFFQEGALVAKTSLPIFSENDDGSTGEEIMDELLSFISFVEPILAEYEFLDLRFDSDNFVLFS